MKDLEFYMKPENFYAFLKEVLVKGFDLLEEKPHAEMCWFWANPQGKKRRLMAVPRDCFKSTIMSIGFPVWDICRNLHQENQSFSYIFDSASKALATRNFMRVKQILKNNKHINEWFGQFYNKNFWGKEDIIIAQQASAGQESERSEPTIHISSVGSEITGWHTSTFLADDWVTKKNVATSYMRGAVKDHWKEIVNVVDKVDGRLFISCTFWHPDDVYSLMMDDKGVRENFEFFIRPIYEDTDNGVKLFFPSKFNWSKIEQLKKELGSKFETQYLLKTISESDKIFPDKHWHTIPESNLPDMKEVWVAYDPADKSSNDGERSLDCIMAIGVDENFKMYVLDCFISPSMEASMSVDTMMYLCKKYSAKLRSLIIEKVLFSKFIEHAMLNYFQKNNVWYPYSLATIDRVGSKKDRIRVLEIRWKNDGIFISGGINDTVTNEIRDEFRTYDKCKYYDCLDTMAMVERNIIVQPKALTPEQIQHEAMWVQAPSGKLGIRGSALLDISRAHLEDLDD